MPGTLNLTILHTNDLHGRVRQLARIATLVRQIRQEVSQAGGHCLYLDAGDSEDNTLVESVLTRGSTMNALLRAAGCDQVALGNAIAIRYGPQAVANLAEHFGKSLLCANLFTKEGDLIPGVIPSHEYQLDGLPLVIIGFTAPMNAFYTNFFGFPVRDPIELMPQLIAESRTRGAKTIIALTHIGSKDDIALAEAVPGIDLIIGGHDHKQITPPLEINHAIIAQSGEYGQMLGRLDLVVDHDTGRIQQHTGSLIPITDDIPEDWEVLQAVSTEKHLIDEMMNLKIGMTDEPISVSEDSECPAGNLQADAILEHVQGARVALMVNGHWVSGLDAGPITQGQLYTANRSAGNPARVMLTGAQIRQWLIKALTPENIARKIHPLRGIPVGMPGIAGMNVIADRTILENLQVFIEGKPINDEEIYPVATTDLEISTILDYLAIPDEEVQYEVPIVLPEIIEEYLKKHSPIGKIQMGRIVFK
jgi:2',3'-cyclic-nucleotide 2'-phosphodiesterase (5'-nucleotidase family)